MSGADFNEFLTNLVVILLAAKFFGELAERWKQPPVFGELLAGVLLGFGLVRFFNPDHHGLALMAQLGVILLLFEIGIGSNLSQLLRVAPSSIVVACVGAAVSFVLGYAAMGLLGYGGASAVFVGAALTATSASITARVLADMGRLNTTEAQIVLGAAIVDDIIGVIILSAVQGIAASGFLSWASVMRTTILAVAFLAVALWSGPHISQPLVAIINRMRVRGVLFVSAVIFVFSMALLAQAAGTALTVGAFTAGLLLAGTDKREEIEKALKPVADIFVPVFFVLVGAKVQFGAYNPFVSANRSSFGIATLVILAAILGKVLSGCAVWRQGLNRLAIGFGMVPRGEVCLIAAQVGLISGNLGPPIYAAIVGTVMATTFAAPILLKRAFR